MEELFPNYIINLEEGFVYSISYNKKIGETPGCDDGHRHKCCEIYDIYGNKYTSIHQVIYAEGAKLPKHLWSIDKNGKRYEIDHIIPVKNGGTDMFSNLRLVSHKKNMNNPETLKKLKENSTGRYPSEETKLKMSEAQKGEKNHFFGKKHTDASKLKMSNAHKGKHKKAIME